MILEKNLDFDVMVTETPGADVRGATARRFVSAAFRAGHRVERVLFYGDGTYILLPGPAQTAWQRLAARHDLRLAVCPAAAERRGLSSLVEASGFTSLGLPAWLADALKADRLLRF